ncbi:hypothetical protein EDC94DRAFT_373811 [Helicostylum pulchrum]|nr:hypothetical protein EDC94DRAFT_373811 [Helicostylum pulchrum]
MRNDPRQRSNWPPPQGPSIPNPAVRASGERKSRWGSVNEAPPQQQQDPWLQRQNIQDPRVANTNNYQAPLPIQPTTTTTATTIRSQYQPAPYQTPQPAYQQQSYQPPPPQQQQSYQQQSYQPLPQQQSYQPPPPQQQQSYQPQQYQPQSSYQSPQHQPQQSHQKQYQPRSNTKGADPVSDTSLPPGCIKGKP